MSSRQESTRWGRWSELMLGGAAAGLGAPLVLRGLRRFLHLEREGSSSASVGWTAGMLGALVAGGLARRRLQAASAGERPATEVGAGGEQWPEPGAALERRARRGPNGREQPWHEALASTLG